MREISQMSHAPKGYLIMTRYIRTLEFAHSHVVLAKHLVIIDGNVGTCITIVIS
jgi:hypothetical protein